MNNNPFNYLDENAQRFSCTWLLLIEIATSEDKNAVGMAFISYVLNLGDEVAQAFAKGECVARHQVGMC